MKSNWLFRLFCSFLPLFADAATDGGGPATDAGAENAAVNGAGEPSGEPAGDEAEAEAADLSVPDKPFDDGESPAEDAGKKPGAEQAKSLFAQLQEEEFGKPAAKPEELPPDVKPESRAGKEIINLRQRAQRAETEIGNYQQAMQQRDAQVTNYLGQVQQQMTALAQENATMRGRLEEITRLGVPRPKEGQESYVDQLMQRFGNEVVNPQLQPILAEVKKAQEQNAALQQELKNRDTAAMTLRDAQQIRQAATEHYFNMVMRGVPREAATEDANLGASMVMALMRARPELMNDMPRAAMLARRFLLRGADLITRHAKAPVAKALQRKEEAPNTVSRSGVGGKVREPIPNEATLVANGFQTPWDWMEAGSPKLKKA